MWSSDAEAQIAIRQAVFSIIIAQSSLIIISLYIHKLTQYQSCKTTIASMACRHLDLLCQRSQLLHMAQLRKPVVPRAGNAGQARCDGLHQRMCLAIKLANTQAQLLCA